MNYLKTLSIALAVGLAAIACDPKEPGESPDPNPTNDDAYTGILSVAPDTPAEFILEDVQVEFFVDPENENTGTIKMMKVKFAAAMPFVLDVMTVNGLTLDETGEGYDFSGDELIPTAKIGDLEEQSYPPATITDLEGSVTEGELTLSMTCMSLPVTYTGIRNAE